MVMRAIAGWGRLAPQPHEWRALAWRDAVARELAAAGAPGIAHGMGRSYGDAALNPGGTLWATRGLDRFVGFDAEHGVLECEAGVTLAEIIALALPRGWFLPVAPGTRWVSVGGAIAADVHGKNHALRGSFGEHLLGMRLVRSNGEVLELSPATHPGLFAATVGGIGLTGVVTTARLQLVRVPGPWIESETLPIGSLAEFVEVSAEQARPESGWEYGVAWIDCLASRGDALRGLFYRGRHAPPRAGEGPPGDRRERGVPFTPPLPLVNRASLAAFNALYHALQRRHAGRVQRTGWRPFFFPLDGLRDWNRLYGRAGFYQYQCVLPRAVQLDATRELLDAIARAGQGSCLAVLKVFGDRAGPGLLSFPMPGITLALDFPNRGARTLRLFETLDAIVARAGGRLYAAKDARMPRTLFEQGYPRLAEFRRWRDPGMASAMSRRLLGD